MTAHRCSECGHDCLDVERRLDVAIRTLRTFDALYAAIVDGADEEGTVIPKPSAEGTA